MKEKDVKGLLALKKRYNSRAIKPPQLEKVTAKFQEESLALVRAAIKKAGLRVADSPALTTKERQPKQPGQPGGSCGFCEVCVTACTDCVAYS